MQRTRKILLWVLIGFLVYAIVTSPGQAADIVRTSFAIIAQAVRSIFVFFDALLRR